MIHLVLLSGGSGTRLWPLSNSSRSKQFLKVLRDADGKHVSMVQRVFGQIRNVHADLDVTIATCASQENSIRSQVDGDYALVLEPERRDTAPAIMLACANLALEQKADAGDTVVVMPIDTYADQAYYDGIMKLDAAVQGSFADLVLLGVEPTYPSEKYGYIVPTSSESDPRRVERFTEKPDEATAEKLIGQGALWNCGVFAFRLGYLTGLTAKYLTADDFEGFRSRYAELPKNSFDYEVVEKADSIGVVSYAGQWKDLGTWNTLTDEMADETAGRVVVDAKTCENVHVINELGLPMVVAGLKDAVIVATPDGVLVTGKEASANIKKQVAAAAESRPMYEERRWGEYRVIDSSVFPDGAKALTKELIVRDGKQLSYQRHAHRSEVWTIVSGTGEVVLDGLVQQVRAGSVVNIAAGTLHAGRSLGGNLHVIEVQQGDILAEEDIERFGDYWRA
ncbi:mannose-1-phosphate guanyltransferase [Eggerthella sp. AM16-19]|uniref:sugar phosphate nucleotidyltransferase n=1 Tax=Eggerthella sp. AM16-19 TaxID=2292042 RepID=UPI000E52160D|nr:sugar phosphate nucleotidyltransferase [Eggerthella sp. AM16-19]RHO42607.1 mannose-1-phosphate guanyltransferase [Eggerthella sp. AM16-19]